MQGHSLRSGDSAASGGSAAAAAAAAEAACALLDAPTFLATRAGRALLAGLAQRQRHADASLAHTAEEAAAAEKRCRGGRRAARGAGPVPWPGRGQEGGDCAAAGCCWGWVDCGHARAAAAEREGATAAPSLLDARMRRWEEAQRRVRAAAKAKLPAAVPTAVAAARPDLITPAPLFSSVRQERAPSCGGTGSPWHSGSTAKAAPPEAGAAAPQQIAALRRERALLRRRLAAAEAEAAASAAQARQRAARLSAELASARLKARRAASGPARGAPAAAQAAACSGGGGGGGGGPTAAAQARSARCLVAGALSDAAAMRESLESLQRRLARLQLVAAQQGS
ncbi:hypothetical protein Rsub_12622 [Raphidocelis subcapitata]|uniref:Uncharacterized protein n=1 Tax=Raphidocelis subcapitata TaxID=307507 RepID=A0A2V0PK62_9CHLO|nr:hypothetical protein Rsub_12622 [Raphidocelis subcapitata]|eukprot:GBF99929.1 hypothetical protein Rsub_12622 [Raphidocelis subcapitata]